MNDADLEQALDQQISQLPKAIAPQRDLWAGIDNAIEHQAQQQTDKVKPRSVVYRLSAVAAGIAVFGFSAWMVMTNNPTIDGIDSIDGQGVVAQQDMANGDDETLNYVNDLSSLFEQQKQALLVKYQDTPSYVDNWQGQLDELDKAAEAIKQALVNDPTNAQLIKMLQQTYQQQLDLINTVNKSPWQTI